MPSPWEPLLAKTLLTGTAIIPVFVSPSGEDVFRAPKELATLALAIILAALTAIGFLLQKLSVDADARHRLRVPVILAAAGMIWGGITTLTSVNPPLSVNGLIYTASLICIALVAGYSLRRVSVTAVAVAILAPALINSIVVLLQATHVWNPWGFPAGTAARLMTSGLLGNPNDVGAYLIPPLLLSIVLAAKRRRHRAVYTALAVVFASALFASETLTAVVAVAAALIVLLAQQRRPLNAVVALLLPVVVLICLILYKPTKLRLARMTEASEFGHYNTIVSGRLIPFAAAWEMFRAHAITGVGPGCFKFEYMAHRSVVRKYFSLPDAPAINFGEVHSDHLQLLAETGLPGYTIAAATLIMVGVGASRRRSGDEKDAVASTLALPIVIGLSVTMLAGFPLQLAAVAIAYALVAGTCLAWRGTDVA